MQDPALTQHIKLLNTNKGKQKETRKASIGFHRLVVVYGVIILLLQKELFDFGIKYVYTWIE